MLNILDGELVRREPAKRPHRGVVGAAVMDSELLGEVANGPVCTCTILKIAEEILLKST